METPAYVAMESLRQRLAELGVALDRNAQEVAQAQESLNDSMDTEIVLRGEQKAISVALAALADHYEARA